MNRHEATRRVMISIAVGPREVHLPYVAEDGSRPLVVTTPGEYLSAVLARVDAVGGSANIAMAEVRNFRIFTIVQADGPASAEFEEQGGDRLNADMSMGMFHIKYKGAGTRQFVIKGVGATVSSDSETFAYA